MTSNANGIGRTLRIVLGLVSIRLAATGTLGLWGWIGMVPLAISLIGWCPPHVLLGWNTCSMKNRT